MEAVSDRAMRWLVLAAALATGAALAWLPLFPLTLMPDAPRAALGLLAAFAPAAWLALRGTPATENVAPALEALVAPHERLDDAIDGSLSLVIGDTETSAMAIMQQLRELHDTAAALVAMLVESRAEAERLDAEITDGLAMLAGMRELITDLPEKISTNLGQVRAVAEQIRELNGLAELVQSISIQSHLLAINAAIEAHRAGEQGRTFRVVAGEVKNLAADSSRAATEISSRLSSTWKAVESGMQAGVDDSLQQLQQIARAAESIRELEQKHNDFSAYYRAQFSAVTEHNEALAADIVDALGRAQYQDVVRQCVERIRATVRRRNAILGDALATAGDSAAAAASLDQLCEQYREEESRHSNADRSTAGVTQTGELTIELF